MKGMTQVLSDLDSARRRIARLRDMNRLSEKAATPILEKILSLRAEVRGLERSEVGSAAN
ncbi:hypothetical protein LCGC14_2400140 [marine sediment metagenome]|uniref:Uncharacterized protein n=1 Tax=marine sediment metagenome TaxID=412755 RepID=A0A0F9BVP3_9ZZZZ